MLYYTPADAIHATAAKANRPPVSGSASPPSRRPRKKSVQHFKFKARKKVSRRRYTRPERMHFLQLIQEQGKIPIRRQDWESVAQLHSKKWFAHLSEEDQIKVQRNGISIKNQFMKLRKQGAGSKSTNLSEDVQLASELTFSDVMYRIHQCDTNAESLDDCDETDSYEEEETEDEEEEATTDGDSVMNEEEIDHDSNVRGKKDHNIVIHNDIHNVDSRNRNQDESIQRVHLGPLITETSISSDRAPASTTSCATAAPGNVENVNATVRDSVEPTNPTVTQHQSVPTLHVTSGSATDKISQFLLASERQRDEDRRMRDQERREERRIREEEYRRRDEEYRRRDEDYRRRDEDYSRRDADDQRRFERVLSVLVENNKSLDHLIT